MERKPIQVQISVDSKKEAERISLFLLESKLAACVQQAKIISRYIWKGQIEKAEEYILFIKTFSDKFEIIEQEIKKRHTYEIPEIIATPIDYISKDYEDWIRESLGD
ncbi:MAG: divalent-cation tolerance protein CutA [Candidatus Heimdallarchaeaceae archaeon]